LDGTQAGYADSKNERDVGNGVMDFATTMGSFVGINEIFEALLEANAAKGTGKVWDAAKLAKEWLGEDAKVVTNKAGDKVITSKDGLRKIRFDIKNSQGDAPHMHLEEFKNGKWRDVISGKHRIYPKL
jgi:hypothetical protein